MKKILIIDVEENIKEQYQKDLASIGCQIILVHTLKEGEQKIREDKPDIITLDIHTPQKEEIGFLESCRLQHENVPFILCTSQGHARQSFPIWASHAHVIKSASIQELKDTIKTVLT